MFYKDYAYFLIIFAAKDKALLDVHVADREGPKASKIHLQKLWLIIKSYHFVISSLFSFQDTTFPSSPPITRMQYFQRVCVCNLEIIFLNNPRIGYYILSF